MTGPRDSRTRFTDRVGFYEASRPTYPGTILPLLRERCGLGPGKTVADLGCGTGLLAQRLLESGCAVIGVEPNAAMRAGAERRLGVSPRFTQREGTAEATGLAGASVDLVAAGQAFHWFDIPQARGECRRILRPGGWAALLWNDRKTRATHFMRAYEALLLRHGTDYREVHHRRLGPEAFDAFFGAGRWRRDDVPNRQELDWEGLQARLFSSSYLPAPGDPRCEAMLEEARRLFDRFQVSGRVELLYDCMVVTGQP